MSFRMDISVTTLDPPFRSGESTRFRISDSYHRTTSAGVCSLYSVSIVSMRPARLEALTRLNSLLKMTRQISEKFASANRLCLTSEVTSEVRSLWTSEYTPRNSSGPIFSRYRHRILETGVFWCVKYFEKPWLIESSGPIRLGSNRSRNLSAKKKRTSSFEIRRSSSSKSTR